MLAAAYHLPHGASRLRSLRSGSFWLPLHASPRGRRACEQYRALRRGRWGEYLVTATAAQPGSP
jgi:hypothetical protein